jgi:hypothetical protein
LTLLASWIVYLKLKSKIQNGRAIGQRVVLKYADQNTTIENELPRTGLIKRKIPIGKTDDNFLIKLEQPINYDNYNFDEIVVRHRHVGRYIGSTSEIDVHLLLPRVKLVKDTYQFDDFSHVAWLTLKTE